MKSHKTFRFGILPLLLVPALMAGLMPARAGAATLIVTNTDDPGIGGCTASGSGDGCTLREAITAANNQTLTPGDDTIDATGISGSITLLTVLPSLGTNIILNGPGAASLTVQRSSVSGTPEFRIFTIDNTTTTGPTVTISGFTIAGGKVSGSNAPANCGGGIYNNHGTLTVSRSVLQNNSATNGGAICNDGSLSVNATLRLSNSTLTSNTAAGGGGGLFNNGSGGGSAPLTISNCIFTGNGATTGGAILNDGRNGGSATITELSNSVLRANTASGNGGGIKNNGTAGGSATLVISFTTLEANTATNGGGIHNDGAGGSATQAISYSTFNANTASANGGAIDNNGISAGSATLTAIASTFNANTAAQGGAILNNGTGGSATVEIDNSTLKANAASVNSAAIDSDGTAGSATLALGSTILDNGPTANLKLTVNSETTFTSKNHNLSSDAAGGDGTTAPGGPYLTAGGDIRNTDPRLDPAGLKDNGGPTKTIALLSDSPAIDQGLSSLPTDQRGAPRPYDNPAVVNASGGDGSDIGAFELGPVLPVLRLVISPTLFSENGGPNAASGVVSRTGPLTDALTVNLSSSDTTEATVQSSVVIPAGAVGVAFPIAAIDDTIIDGPQKVAIIVSASGFTGTKTSVMVTDNEAKLTLTITPGVFFETAGAQAATATVTRNTPTNLAVKISLLSGNTSKVTVPNSVTIPIGAKSTTFFLSAVDNTIADGPLRVGISARVKGYITASAGVTVLDNEARLTLTINPATFGEGAGDNAATAILTRNTPTNVPLTVGVTSSDTTEAKVPTSVTFQIGSNTVSFGITAVDDDLVDGPRNVTITAGAAPYGYPPVSKGVTVTDNEPALRIAASTAAPTVLSSASISGSSLVLNFAVALDSSAADPARYSVQSNGAPVAVQSAALKGSSVTLGLADGVLKSGDQVSVTYDLIAGGRSVAGQTTVTAR